MTEVEQQGRRLARARATQQQVMEGLRVVVRAAAASGVSESELARQAGVDRMTIRKILGKC